MSIHADKTDDEYGKVELVSLNISDVIIKELKYHGKCYQVLTQAAVASLSATMNDNNRKRRK